MTQTLNVKMSIPIPEDSILIKKVEFEELKRESLSGTYWTMKDLSGRINKSDKWIKENILYPSRFKRLLDSKNGGCVYYPESQGQSWSFQAVGMSDFLDRYFTKIFNQEVSV